jgi:cell division protein FtsI/penicillin-binding protein 2
MSAVFILRLFYLQIIRHAYYKNSALVSQLKEYEIPPARGVIEAYSGGQRVPFVLNESRYTLFADPKFIEDPGQIATKIEKVLGGEASEYSERMKSDSRYVVLAKKLSADNKKAIDELGLKGIGTRETPVRSYPQGSLASQLLGFVDDDGAGRYGIEEALDEEFSGVPGRLRAITDASGVPLAANDDNVVTPPKNGRKVVLTIDIGMQQQLEEILKDGVKKAIAPSGGAIIIEAKSGAVKAMANYPTYNPSEFASVADKNIGLFENKIVSSPLEVGSTMKPFTVGAALDLGVVKKNTSYYDPAFYKVDGSVIRNVEEDGGAAHRNIQDILRYSLNTGATWLLMQMGDGSINHKARNHWHDYMTNKYQFGKITGIEQGLERPGVIPDPNEGYGLNLRFANSTFGQGMTATPLQMASALSGLVNGGTYYKPHLVDRYIEDNGQEVLNKPKVAPNIVVGEKVSQQVRELMIYVHSQNHRAWGMPDVRAKYSIGGKTGTAQVPNPEGGYFENKENGTFIGFVGGDEPEYIIVVRVDDAKIAGYAGSKAAAPIFGRLADSLIDKFGVTPKTR